MYTCSVVFCIPSTLKRTSRLEVRACALRSIPLHVVVHTRKLVLRVPYSYYEIINYERCNDKLDARLSTFFSLFRRTYLVSRVCAYIFSLIVDRVYETVAIDGRPNQDVCFFLSRSIIKT